MLPSLRYVISSPRNAAGFELAKQLIRSAGSVGANYRAACRGKSTADFIYKLEIVIEEADESLYWLEVCVDSALLETEKVAALIKEANELTSIFVASVKTIKANNSTQDDRRRNQKSEF